MYLSTQVQKFEAKCEVKVLDLNFFWLSFLQSTNLERRSKQALFHQTSFLYKSSKLVKISETVSKLCKYLTIEKKENNRQWLTIFLHFCIMNELLKLLIQSWLRIRELQIRAFPLFDPKSTEWRIRKFSTFPYLTRAGAEAIIRFGDLRSEFTALLTITRIQRADSLREKKRERIRYNGARTG